jgi:putative tricarboxylic transport membrane protein
LEAKRSSKNKASFGKGNPEKVVAAECANNSVTGAAMVPVLSLGIPGDPLTASMMGVFIVHNIFPRSQLFIEEVELVYGIFISMFLINIVALGILIFSARRISGVINTNPAILAVCIMAFSLIGAYSVANVFSNIWVALGAGIFGYLARCFGFPLIGFVLGIIWGPMVEERLR